MSEEERDWGDVAPKHWDREGRLPYEEVLKRRNKFREKKLLRSYIMKRDNYCCQQCGFLGSYDDTSGLSIDHIVDISFGGTDAPENLQVLCETCNNTKSNNPEKFRRRYQCNGKVLRPQ